MSVTINLAVLWSSETAVTIDNNHGVISEKT